MDRQCAWCHRELKSDNPGKLCVVCAHKLKDVVVDLPEVLDVEDVRELLHLETAETVRRKHRKGELPDCIPGQKKLLWLKDDIMAYLKFGQSFSAASAEKIQAIAKALELGWPIDQMTGYGLDPQNLIDALKEFGYLKDDKGSRDKGIG
ncbi:hypothetical protein ES708_07602 [subsurface metagenome]